ncbi:MAG: EthD family reductase [Pseudonocardia sp.]|nr:EthD family reductase [Pseudonocardia sp.]
MTYQLTVLYHHPEDAAAFDRYYDGTHIPLAAKLPGLRSCSVSRPGPSGDGNRPPYYLIAVLTWDSVEAFEAAVSSAEGQATLADLPNFAGAGVDMCTGPSIAVV